MTEHGGTLRPCPGAEREFAFSPENFRRVAELAHAEAGIAVPDGKEPLVYARLVKRLRQLSLASFTDYLDLLEQPGAEDERTMFVSTMTTNTTRFFREPHHFEMLAESVLPPLLADARRGRRVRLWSAGCSSGEEPYSIALTVLRLCPEAAMLDLKILATDVDRQILEVARRGIYPERALACLPEAMRRQHFAPHLPSGGRALADAARSLVTFKAMNLVRPWPVSGPFDVIFCRNVAIYFDADTQDGIWRGFAATLAPGGYLFIGHSERLSPSIKHEFDTAGMTTFRLRGPAAPGGHRKGED